MPKHARLVLPLLLLVGCLSTPAQPRIDVRRSISDQISARLETIAQRFYTGDPLAYVELLTEDVTYFAPITPGRVEGRDSVRALFAPFQGKLSVPRFEILSPKLQLYGDVGVFSYNLNEYAADGTISVRWNSTEVYRRHGQTWQIVHAHWSQIPKSQ